MNKKFLSAILFGALMVTSTGTFVSCKDYDDDIENLQTQVDATKSDLAAKVSSLESSISSLQSAQSSLDSKIAAAKDAAAKAAAEAQEAAIAAAEDAAAKAEAAAKAAAELAAAEAQAAAVAAAEEKLAAAKAELTAAIAEMEAGHAADIEALEVAVAEAAEAANVKMAELSGAIQTLQAFSVTTTETLEDLAAADAALQTSIKDLDAKIAEQAVLVGKNTTAITAQTEALANYKKALEEYQLANNEAVAGNADAIAKIENTLADMKAAADAQAKALNDYIAANNAAVEGNAASIKNNADAIETLAADIKALQEGTLTEAKVTEIAEQVTEKVQGNLDLMSAIFNKMITNVSLVKVLVEADFIDLNLVSAKAVRTWTFGEGMPGAIPFVKGAKETFEEEFVVRVSPANAAVDEGTLKLVNSQMGDLDELIDIVNVEPFTGLLTTGSRGVSENGLWKVTVKLDKEYDEADYEAAAWTHNSSGSREDQIVYAVMVADKDNTERQVISEYGITLGSAARKSLRTLDFNVNTTSVAGIHNRWNGLDQAGEPQAVTEMSVDKVPFLEKAWNVTTDANDNYIYSPWDVPTYNDDPNTTKNDINVINDENDMRNALAAYSVKAGQVFTVNYNNIEDADHIRGFYVTLDEECAVESAPSEIRAWEAYKIEGLNKVSALNNAIELTIPEAAGAEGDYIGFRVFAVNYDGSLVDPDGKAFYVYVGETDKGIANLTLSIDEKVVIPLQTVTTSTKDDFSTAKWGRAQGGKYELVIKDAAGNVANVADWTNFKFTYVDGNGNTQIVALFNDAENLIDDAAITKITTVEMINVSASDLKDGMTYTATITAKNTNSGNVAIATVKFTKQLPGFPAYMQPFTGQIVGGNLMVFPYYDATADAALYDMTSSWHGLVKDQDGNTTVTAESFIHNVTSNPQFTYNSSSNILTAVKGHLNPAAQTYLTKWPTKLTYNYGEISYKYVNNAWRINEHITSWGQGFTLQLGNYVNECKYSMDTNLKIVYPGAIGKTSKFELSKVVIKDWYNAAVSLKRIMEQTNDSKEAKFFDSDFKVEFLTGANFDIVDEYYEFAGIEDETLVDADGDTYTVPYIYMTSKSDAATGNPVVTKVRLTFKDKFGNEIVKIVNGSFTMNYQE